MQKTMLPIVIIVTLAFVGVLIYFLSPVLTPFLVGALLAYLFDPLVKKLTRLRIPRVLSIILVFLMIIFILVMLVLFLFPIIKKQIIVLIDEIPAMIEWVQTKIVPWFMLHFGSPEQIDVNELKVGLAGLLTKAGGALTWTWSTVLRSGAVVISWIMNLLLIPVVTFYLLLDWDKFIHGLRDLLPRSIEPTVVKLVKESDAVLSAFFRGQLLVMLSLGIIYSIGLSLIGLKIGVMIGLISGLLSIVPYLGFIVGLSVASIASVVQFGDFTSILWVILVFGIGQVIESTLLTPNLVGDRIGLHPVAVIFAVLAGGSLFGFFGVLLALPVAAVVMVWVRYLHKQYRHSKLYR